MRIKIVMIAALLLAATLMSAQQAPAIVKGKVKSEKGRVPYINVMLKGTMQGTVTSEDGHFVIENVDPGNHTLIVKGIGYKSREINIQLEPNETEEVELTVEPDLINMDGVVVSASRYETSRKDAPVVVNTIDSRLFETTQSVSLAEGLNFTPGLRLENNCQNCGFTQVRMNGLDGPYSQVLVNSRPVFSALAGVYGLEQIPAAMIDRVEVVRGGGSALYGGNAIAGTINIITKEPCENTWQLGMQQGFIDGTTPDRVINANAALVSEDMRNGLFIFGLLRDREPWNANPNELWDANADGEAETKDDFSEIFLLESRSFGLNAYHRTGKNGKLTADLYNLNEFRRGGNDFDKLPHLSDITEQAETDMLGGGLSFETFTTNQKHKFSAYTSVQNLNRDTYYGAEQDPDAYGSTKEITTIAGVQYGGNYDKHIFAPGLLTAGVEWKYQDLFDEKLGTQNVTVADQQINSLGLYAQNDWDLKWFKLQAGVRYDLHTRMDNGIFSPRLNVLKHLGEHWQLRAGYSTGFRPPQIFSEDLHIEVAGARRVITRVDENLKAERSESYTTSVDYTGTIAGSDFYILAEGFYTKLENAFVSEITSDPSTESVIMFRTNGSGATVNGVNLEMKYVPVRDLLIQAGFTLQQSKYNEEEVLWEPESGNQDSVVSTHDMLRTPNSYGYLNVSYKPTHHWSISVSGTYTGSMIAPHMVDAETEFTVMEETPVFFDLNSKISYHMHLKDKMRLEFFVGVKNVFNSFQSDFDAGINRDAGYVYGPTLPRTFIFGFKTGMFR